MPELALEIARNIIQQSHSMTLARGKNGNVNNSSANMNPNMSINATGQQNNGNLKTSSTQTIEPIRMVVPIRVPHNILALQNKFLTNLQEYSKVIESGIYASEEMKYFSSSFTKSIATKRSKSLYRNNFEAKASTTMQAVIDIGNELILEHESSMAIKFSNFYNDHSEEWQGRSIVNSLEAQITVHTSRLNYKKGNQRNTSSHFIIELTDIRQTTFSQIEKEIEDGKEDSFDSNRSQLIESEGNNNKVSAKYEDLEQGDNWYDNKLQQFENRMDSIQQTPASPNLHSQVNTNANMISYPDQILSPSSIGNIHSSITTNHADSGLFQVKREFLLSPTNASPNFPDKNPSPVIEEIIILGDNREDESAQSSKQQIPELQPNMSRTIMKHSMIHVLGSPMISPSNSQSMINSQSISRRELVKPLQPIKKHLSVKQENKVEQLHAKGIDSFSSSQNYIAKRFYQKQKQDKKQQASEIQTGTEYTLKDPSNFNRSSKIIEDDAQNQFQLHGNNFHKKSGNITKKQLLDPKQRGGTSVSSMKSHKSSSEEIIPQIIKRTNPMSLFRLQITLSAIIVVYFLLNVSFGLITLPLLKNLKNIVNEFEPIQSLNNAYFQSQLYSLIFSAMKFSMYPDFYSSIYKSEVISAGVNQAENYHMNSEEIQRSNMNLNIQVDDRIVSLYVFPNLQQRIDVVDFRTQQGLQNDKIILASRYESQDKLHIESMLFLSMNLVLNIQQTRGIADDIIMMFNEQVSEMTSGTMLVLYLAIGAYTCIIFWSAYVVKQINTYNLKILHLITRVSFADALNEIDKFERIYDLLGVQQTDSWVHVDFKRIIIRNTTQKETSAQGRLHSSIIKNKKDQQVSSMINDANLPIAQSLAAIFSLSFVSLGFLALFVIIGQLQVSDLQPQLHIYSAIANAHTDYSALMSLSELMVAFQFFQNQGPSILGNVNLNVIANDLSERFSENANAIRGFNTNITEIILSYQGSSAESLQQMFQDDLCTIFSDSISCGNQSTNGESFSKGIIGFISKTLSLFTSYNDLIMNYVEKNGYSSTLSNYLTEDAHTDLVVRNYEIPQKSFSKSENIVVAQLGSSIDSFSLFTIAYLFGGLLFLTGILFFSTKLILIKMQELIKLINFSLYLIPYYKLSEENTRHLLKQLLLQ